MLSVFKHGRCHGPLQLVQSEVKLCRSFQLRNLRVPHFQPEDSWPSLPGVGPKQNQTVTKDFGQSSASASSLAFDPSSGGGALKLVRGQADGADALQAITPSGAGTASLSFDPSSGSGASPLESDTGPSTSGTSGTYTLRSEDTKLLGKMLRSDLAAELTAVGLFKGRRLVAAGNRPDLDYFQDQEKGHLQQLQSLIPGYRARPSLLGPVAAATGFALGAAAGVLPTKLSHAITGATQEALVEQYNDQLRELREAGLSERAEEVREALRTLRDEERAPESSVKVPDIMSLQRPQDLTLEEGVAAVVKFGLGNLFSLAAKV